MNTYNLISLFSGCGGNSLGFTMTDRYKILTANEFVPEAKKTYEANFPNTFVFDDDIRKLNGDIILKTIAKTKDEIDILDGSPPCKSFTTAGNLNKGWNKISHYSEGISQKTDDLYFEYIRLLRELQPKVFVAENVKGLMIGRSKGYFNSIFTEMEKAGYVVRASLLNASHYGVAQNRERLFYVGIRRDIYDEKTMTTSFFPMPTRIKPLTVREAFDLYNVNSDLEKYRWELSEAEKIAPYIKKVAILTPQGSRGSDVMNGSYFSLSRLAWNRAAPTVLSIAANSKNDHIHPTRRSGLLHPVETRYLTISELKAISSFPQNFILTGNFAQQWERIARAVPPLLMKALADNIAKKILDRINI